MKMPKVTEISALSAHRREVALVRWSILAVPAQAGETASGPDPLRTRDPRVLPTDPRLRTW
jgi:hypothetical protein